LFSDQLTKIFKMMTFSYASHPLLKFLKQELALSDASLAVAKRTAQDNYNALPIVLWQYGLITLDELDRIYDWLDQG
jgi:hypothetical protein